MILEACWDDGLWTLFLFLGSHNLMVTALGSCVKQSPTLGAHAHAHAHPWVLGGHGCNVIVHGCAWVGIGFVHSCIQLQIIVKLLGCREYANQDALRTEANDSERLIFVRSNQDLVYAGNTHYIILNT
jgi:hypothetical protein